MIKNITAIFKVSLVVLAGVLTLQSCESEADNLGSQFFEDGMANGTEQSEDIIAYNVSHNDTIRTDAARLSATLVGAFTEPQFGMQKASYVTQVRMASYAPDFGTNPVVDSVVLVLKPAYAKDSVTTKTYEDYTYPEGNVAAKKVVNTYPLTKYGKTKSSLTLNVHEVKDFLGGASDLAYSNKQVALGSLIGTKSLAGTVSSVMITKDADNSTLLTRDATLRIPLDKAFFQSKIIAKKGSAELSDVSNFIRYFNGIRISVEENDGYMLKFNPNEAEMVMYYKRDVTANGTTTPAQTSFSFALGAGNVHFSQVDYNRSSAASALAGYNSTTGDARLYPQGMGGNGIGIKIPAATIDKIRKLYKEQNVGILSAKIRLYSDASVWNNAYDKPNSFTAEQLGSTTFLSDIMALGSSGMFNLVKAYDLAKNPAYYDVTITQTFKDIVEKSAENKDIILNVGTYETNAANTALISPNYNTRAYTPNRVVLVGTDAANSKRAQLKIIYTKK